MVDPLVSRISWETEEKKEGVWMPPPSGVRLSISVCPIDLFLRYIHVQCPPRRWGLFRGGGPVDLFAGFSPGIPAVRDTVQGTWRVRRSSRSALSFCERPVGYLSAWCLCWLCTPSKRLIGPPRGFNGSVDSALLRGPVYPILCRMISLLSLALSGLRLSSVSLVGRRI